MYTMYCDDKPLYSPQLVQEGYGVIEPKITEELNKSGSLEFTLPPNNVCYESIKKLTSRITVMQDDDEIFRGRVLNDSKDFYRQKQVYAEGELAFLVDSLQRPYDFKGPPETLFRRIIANHNAAVEPEKRFEIGEMTVTDPNNYIARSSSEYSTSWDTINSKLISGLGGYLKTRKDNDTLFLDYLESPGGTSGQIIEFGKNLLDFEEFISAEDVFTILIPVGADIKDEEGNVIGTTSIKELNNGKDYIENETAIRLFGRIEKTMKWEDVTLPENLLRKGNDYLRKGIELATTLTLKAVDLHLIDVQTDKIRVGDLVRVISLPHQLDGYFLCTKIVTNIQNPQSSEYTFGTSIKSITDRTIAYKI